jgi:large subunit ribosomal protein L25
LKVGGKAETVLLKELQRDFLTHAVIHADFQRISMTDKLEVNVPLHITGEAPGVKLGGGILEHVLREVRVSCLPSDIPDGLNVDVSRLQLNQGLKIKDLAPLPGVEVLNEPESIVVNIVAPAAEEVAPVAAAAPVAAGSTEPEVIAKGKKPEEGEAAVAAPAAGAAKGKQPPAKEKK